MKRRELLKLLGLGALGTAAAEQDTKALAQLPKTELVPSPPKGRTLLDVNLTWNGELGKLELHKTYWDKDLNDVVIESDIIQCLNWD